MPEHSTSWPCASSIADGKSAHARPVGHARAAQFGPVQPDMHVHLKPSAADVAPWPEQWWSSSSFRGVRAASDDSRHRSHHRAMARGPAVRGLGGGDATARCGCPRHERSSGSLVQRRAEPVVRCEAFSAPKNTRGPRFFLRETRSCHRRRYY